MSHTPFRHPFTVRFDHIDAAGIAFYGRVFEYSHHAYEAMLTAAGLPIEVLLDGSYALPLVHCEADFKRPFRLGEAIIAELALTRQGTSSFTLRTTFIGPEGEVRAVVSTVHACIDRASFRPLPLPQELLTALYGVMGAVALP